LPDDAAALVGALVERGAAALQRASAGGRMGHLAASNASKNATPSTPGASGGFVADPALSR
jgi:hypothetical protein